MKAKAVLARDFVIADVDKRVYGSFLEHLGRAVYTGIYEPGHPKADANGFRTDVIDLVRELAPPVVRYPGGNFVSAYNWEDGVGPRDQRPTRLDLAWRTKESNQIGLNEFADWCKLAGTEMMMAVNLGSRGLDAARNIVEYCNYKGGTAWSDLRIKHGWKEPHNVKLWCLGNEMDGPWQVGHKTAREYGALANETAKAMRGFDPSLELIVCGSSHANMPTFPSWEYEVLDECYDTVDYLSLHMYYENYEKDSLLFFSKIEEMNRYISSVGSVIAHVKAKKRSKRNVYISFDEWNVWYHERENDAKRMAEWDWPEAPRLLEDIYTFEDVLEVGSALNALIRHADVVKVACIAQLINVIAPIMTEPGGPAWRQTIYWPFLFASKYGRGTSLRVAVESPAFSTKIASDVPYLDLTAVLAPDAKSVAMFVVNRHLTEDMELTVPLQGFKPAAVIEHQQIAGYPLDARNTLESPETVKPVAVSGAKIDDGALKVKLPPLSYSMIRVAV